MFQRQEWESPPLRGHACCIENERDIGDIDIVKREIFLQVPQRTDVVFPPIDHGVGDEYDTIHTL